MMVRVVSCVVSILMINNSLGQICGNQGQQVVVIDDGQCDYNPWFLVFEDNFNGTELDFSKWTVPYQGVIRDDNHTKEKQWYANTGSTPSIPISNNIEVSNGTLKLIARRENPPITGTWVTDWSTNPPTTKTSSFEYSSAEIDSKYKFGYGKYEIRCKIPSGVGFWPAFWMYGEKGNVNNEIDVFEFWDGSTTNHNMTTHYNGLMCGTSYNGPDFSQAFHTFTVIWTPHKIEWYVDGDLKRRSTKFYTIQGQAVDCNGVQAFGQYILNKVFPKDPMNIIANLAIDKNPLPNGNTPFPSFLEIDYIRYYQKKECMNTINVAHISELDLSNEIYNLIVGTKITVGGNFTLQSVKQLELIAMDEIILEPGFSVETGSDFYARINPSVCSGANKMEEVSYNDSSFYSYDTLDSDISARQLQDHFKIYPNPNSGVFSIEFGKPSDYELHLIDQQGRAIVSLNSIGKTKMEINMTDYEKGNYVLNILDTKNRNVYVNKIIYK